MSISSNTWGTRLKEARLATKMSQKTLGITTGLDPSVASTRINRYELGIHRPDYKMEARLAESLQIPIGFLYEPNDKLAYMLLHISRLPEEEMRLLIEFISTLK